MSLPLAPPPDDDEEERPRDRPFNPWRIPATPKARELVVEAVRRVESYEAYLKPRKRRRKQNDRLTFEATVSALVCDLVHHHLSQGEGEVAITRDKRRLARASRYRPAVLNARLPHILDCMASDDLAIIDLTPGDRREKLQTTIMAGPVLRSWIEDERLTFADLGRDDAEELILLKGDKPKRGEEAPPNVEPKAPLVEYTDTPATRRMREELRTVNAWLAGADISLVAHPQTKHIDPGDRRLRRHFTRASFESGGRLFGAFWLTLPRVLRRYLRINGEPVVAIDFRGMFIALAYARVGADLPCSDPYAIPGVERWRKGMKLLVHASLFRDDPMVRAPRKTRKHLPAGVSVRDLMVKFADHHAPIAHLLGSQTGHELMYTESAILVAVLLRLRDLGIIGLPLHDAIIAPRSKRDAVRRVMVEEFRSRMGKPIEVEEQV